MKKILLGAMCAAAALAAVSSAHASGGCGVNYHRDVNGYCRLNPYGRQVETTPTGRNVVVGQFYPGRGYWDGQRYSPVVLSVGVFYSGRGYWDGRRYWAHRDRDDRAGWRYR